MRGIPFAYWANQGSQSFFFDTFPVDPLFVFALEKMSSLANSTACILTDNTGANSTEVYYNADGTITASSPTNLGSQTLGDIIGSINRLDILYNQMDGGFTSAQNTAIAVTVGFDSNGKLIVQSGSIAGTSCAMVTVEDWIIAQPINLTYRTQVNVGDSNLKRCFQLKDSVNALIGFHAGIRFALFGNISFGTSRTITDNISAAPTVVNVLGDGANGNVWVNNAAKNPANMGTNGAQGKIEFWPRGIASTHFIGFDAELTSGERTDLFDYINAY